jgi:hypothetical protein
MRGFGGLADPCQRFLAPIRMHSEFITKLINAQTTTDRCEASANFKSSSRLINPLKFFLFLLHARIWVQGDEYLRAKLVVACQGG